MQNKKTTLIADTSVLIDLDKTQLLGAIFTGHFRVVIPEPVWAEEVEPSYARFELAHFKLIQSSAEIRGMDSEMVWKVNDMAQRYKGLSKNDGFCIVMADSIEASVLLTGDKLLKESAEEYGINVHGVLWAYDQIRTLGICPPKVLRAALELWRDDSTVFLDNEEIDKRLKSI